MLLFDMTALQGVGKTQRHGGGKYTEVIFFSLCERTSDFSAMWDSHNWINPNVYNKCNELGIPLYDCHQMKIDEIVKKYNITYIYSAQPERHGLQLYKGCHVIGTIHGLRGLEIQHEWMNLRYPAPLRIKIKEAIKLLLFSKKIHHRTKKYYNQFLQNQHFTFYTVSNHTKYSILANFPTIKQDQIRVYYSPSTSYSETATKTEGVEKFFLIVSANRTVKNSLRAIIALDRLFSIKKLDGFYVRITGVSHNVFNYKLKNPHRFTFLGYVDESALNQLYVDAFALIYPSFSEGFGYPPLEAMRYGIPIIASPFTSIPEVCGDAAIYFNPFSIEELMARILYISTSNLANIYSEKSKRRYEIITKKQNEDLRLLVDYLINIVKCE